MEVIVEEKKRNEREDGSHALFSQVVKSNWYLQHLFVCHLERSCVLWCRTEIKVKVLFFVLSLLALFKAMCSHLEKELFSLSNPYRSWKEAPWSYWDSRKGTHRLEPRFEIWIFAWICLNVFKKNFFTCYLLLFTC